MFIHHLSPSFNVKGSEVVRSGSQVDHSAVIGIAGSFISVTVDKLRMYHDVRRMSFFTLREDAVIVELTKQLLFEDVQELNRDIGGVVAARWLSSPKFSPTIWAI